MSEEASLFVGSIPENYDRYLVPLIFDGYAADIAERTARLNPASVLELAAGTGIVTQKLRELLPAESRIVATDLNEPMLDVARSRLRSMESVEFAPADGVDLPLSEETFDAIVCQFGVMFFPDKVRSYAEALRVLRPGGAYLFNAWDSWSENPFAEVVHKVVSALFPDNPPKFYKVPFHYHDPDEIRRELSEAGFGQISIEHVRLTSKIDSAEDFARGLVSGNPLNEEILGQGGNPNAACSAIANAIEEHLGTEMPLSALVVEAKNI